MTIDVTHLNGSPTRDLALNILDGDAGWRYRGAWLAKVPAPGISVSSSLSLPSAVVALRA